MPERERPDYGFAAALSLAVGALVCGLAATVASERSRWP